MNSDEYAIVPEKEVEVLKKDIEEIKKNPLAASPSGRELIRALKDLTDSINHLIALFRDAADAMRLEEKESEAIGKKLEPMLEKFNILIDQNEKIAKGIVGIAEMVKEDLAKPSRQTPVIRVVPPPATSTGYVYPSPQPTPIPPAQPSPSSPPISSAAAPMGPAQSIPSLQPRPMPEMPGMMPPPPPPLQSIQPPAAPKEEKKKLFGF
ncbi:MAG: hypothetical protein N3D84_02550 [Candidatus Woesearchaeota archaeon]|nr:hypothetical protein [Candidatus Woesearchaeota archaeon]